MDRTLHYQTYEDWVIKLVPYSETASLKRRNKRKTSIGPVNLFKIMHLI